VTGLVAYLALVVVVPALLLGHQGQDWPLKVAWRGATGPLWARGRVEARMFTRARVRRSTGRTATREPRHIPTAPPSRGTERRCGAPQGVGGGIPYRTNSKAPRGHTANLDHQEAA